MATSGSSFKPENPSSSQFNGHLEKIEQQKLNRKLMFLCLGWGIYGSM
jgi:hypothetical protein